MLPLTPAAPPSSTGLFRLLQTGMAVAIAFIAAAALAAPPPGDARRGEYLMKAAGCMGCHTAETKGAAPFAGGRELKTPFGTFFGPNITPHAQAGLGRWTEADFVRAMRDGRRPDGGHYFPAFPYPSFTKMTDEDLKNLWAFMRMIPPNSQASREHELKFPFGFRPLVLAWKWLFFTPGADPVNPKLTPVQARGAYLVNALGHCGECHTPRNFMGGPNKARLLAGTKKGPDGKGVPNITPASLKKWGDGELKEFLVGGMTPDGDVPAESMGEVIRNTTSQITPQDLAAMIAYLRAVPAVASEN